MKFFLKIIVDTALRDVERHVMLWNDEHARSIENQSSLQQILVRKPNSKIFICKIFF